MNFLQTRIKSTKSLESIAKEIADFVIRYSDGLYNESERSAVEGYVKIHINYSTIMLIRDMDGKIVAVCRWNWLEWDRARVLDLIIRPDFRNGKVLRDMLLRAKLQFPQLKTLTFFRKNGGSLRSSTYLVNKFLGVSNGKGK